jgi:hypothetical protein
MHELSGGCHCGNIVVRVRLSRVPDSYSPRACDCDFCRKHGAAYLSDTAGSLTIHIRNPRDSSSYRQGSGAAECLVCRNCGVLIAALYRGAEQSYATVNVRILETGASFAAEQPVSPHKLSEAEKIQRWQQLWFANVEVIS